MHQGRGEGVASADEYQAAKLDNAAKYGELKAVQTGGQMTRSLNTTLGNISAVRAAAGADPNSPTGQAVGGALNAYLPLASTHLGSVDIPIAPAPAGLGLLAVGGLLCGRQRRPPKNTR